MRVFMFFIAWALAFFAQYALNDFETISIFKAIGTTLLVGFIFTIGALDEIIKQLKEKK